ncbi:hypothetical protein CIPAW_05G209800 [Carya illinoinensis]|uniref:Leucine-rich repeat-containing N-terminal plant-type domain-containing protein n=1 Tax=Carya illinoinensis TaxID=32201 RepID=A0A8T1QM32_CARIL|nr:hypothetical protein CIPAW_05G209800 [Carya illinoinensis]
MRGCYPQFLLLLLGLLPCSSTKLGFSSNLHTNSKVRCIEEERQTLLQSEQHLVDPYHWLSSWDNGAEDCCKWGGIKCSNKTRHVVKFDLRSDWPYAELATKYLEGEISSSLLGLQLQYLNLSNANIAGAIPQQLGNLLGLISLDHSWNYDLMEAHDLDWLIHLPSLTHLDLEGVNLSQVVNWPNTVMMLPSLMHLSLTDCNLSRNYLNCSIFHWLSNSTTSLVDLVLAVNELQCSIPDAFGSISSLRTLQLYGNKLVGGIPKSFWNLCSLDSLYLSYNNLSGNLYEFMSNASGCLVDSLQKFQISNNRFKGPLPKSIGNLSNLQMLDVSENSLAGLSDCWTCIRDLVVLNLANNNFYGKIPHSRGSLSSIEFLHLSHNGLVGKIPKSLQELQNNLSGLISSKIGLLKNLESLDLSRNQLCGEIPMSISNISFLSQLDFNNRFTRPLLKSIGSLSNLQMLDVYENSITRVITEAHFSNLFKLKKLYLDFYPLNLRFSYDWVPPFQLDVISLSSCRLGSTFLMWLQSQKNYNTLDISNVGISDIIPTWFWDFPPRLSNLYMHNNQLHGNLPDFSSSRLCELVVIDLSTNLFDGSISHFPSNVLSLDLSNNRFFGPISFLCELNTPTLLDSLNLPNNKLSGELPNSMGSLISIKLLHLSNNGFVGKIPTSLKKCSELITVDLGGNNLSEMVPPWIGNSLPNLDILNLRSNQLDGSLPLNLCRLQHIQILELYLNKIEGTIPKWIYNLTAMSLSKKQSYNFVRGLRSGYGDHAKLVWKGREYILNSSIFIGNPKLCCSPLPNKCLEDLHPIYVNTRNHKNDYIERDYDNRFITRGFYIARTLGFIGGFWGVCFILVINIRYIMKRLTSNT